MELQLNQLTFNIEQAGSGRPLLLLHGFTGSSASWAACFPNLAPYFHCIAIDMIGHGRSAAPPDAERYGMEPCIADLLALLDRLDLERADVLGYSMGGRVALQFAAAAPTRVHRLVLESSSPGLADPAERQARISADNALAARIERDGLTAFIDYWERIPLFASQAALPAEVRAQLRAQRMQNSPRGLANSLRGMGTGQQSSLWDRLHTLNVPTLLLAGTLDPKYSAIAQQMAALLPQAQTRIITGVGHTMHLEDRNAFLNNVLEFLTATPTTPTENE